MKTIPVRWVALSILCALVMGCARADTASTGPRNTGTTATSPSRVKPSAGVGAASPISDRSEISDTSEASTADPSWGHLRGRFIFDGPPVEGARLLVTKDQEFCGKHDLVDESVVVNKDNGGLADVVVSLYLGRGDDPPLVHPSYEQSVASQVRLDNENCRFEPRVSLLRTSQTLVIGNKDSVGHNTKVDTMFNPPINPITPAGGTIEHKFSVAERAPARVSCSIHPWMSAWVLVSDNPYFSKTDEDGHFEIKNVPTGQWTFQFWHGKAKNISEVVRDGKTERLRRGRLTIGIEPGENDLGEIRVKPELFQ